MRIASAHTNWVGRFASVVAALAFASFPAALRAEIAITGPNDGLPQKGCNDVPSNPPAKRYSVSVIATMTEQILGVGIQSFKVVIKGNCISVDAGGGSVCDLQESVGGTVLPPRQCMNATDCEIVLFAKNYTQGFPGSVTIPPFPGIDPPGTTTLPIGSRPDGHNVVIQATNTNGQVKTLDPPLGVCQVGVATPAVGWRESGLIAVGVTAIGLALLVRRRGREQDTGIA